MWKWLNRRRSRHRSRNDENTSTLERTACDAETPSTSDDTSGLLSTFFKPSVHIPALPPKCLRRFTFSNILYGERIEDFSSECWLENSLHHFGLPANQQQLVLRSNTNEGISFRSRLTEDVIDNSSTGSSDTDDSISSLIDYSDVNNEADFTMQEQERPRLALEELFNPLPEIGNDLNSDDFGNIILQRPPPYSEFDLPPTYEEAVGEFERRSCGTRSSQSSSLAFMW